MNLTELFSFCQDKIKEFPELKEDIIDLYQLAVDEVDEGGSEHHECELAFNEINDIIKDETS